MNEENEYQAAPSSLLSKRRERNQVASLFKESIHPQTEEPEKELRKYGIDIPMLLITMGLVLFGCVMIYSASSVFAVSNHGESTYFIVRHLIFLIMAVAFTFVVVKLCTPYFWRDMAYVLFAVSVVLLLLVFLLLLLLPFHFPPMNRLFTN